MKKTVKDYAISQVTYLLSDLKHRAKIAEGKKVLEQLGIRLEARDVTPLVDAVRGSGAVDASNQQVADEAAVRLYFELLADFLAGTPELKYYNSFAKIKLDHAPRTNYKYVNLGLKIFDARNWSNSRPSPELQQEIKNFYFATFLNSSLSGEEKLYNLGILHNELNISIGEPERNELASALKTKIIGLVDLLDNTRKTPPSYMDAAKPAAPERPTAPPGRPERR